MASPLFSPPPVLPHRLRAPPRPVSSPSRLSVGEVNGKAAVVLPEREVFPLPVMYDDGFGSASVKDYLDSAREIIRPDGGPPRWFCPVDCGQPIPGAPLLFFMPGLDGTGMGLILHHKPLGKCFEVRCLHIPVNDRTPFEALVKFIEQTVRDEYALSPNKPIYLVGDSFGGCVALAVAARNPTIDLVLILANPATSFSRSELQPIFPILDAIPNELHVAVPYLLSFIMGEPVKLAMASVADGLSPSDTLDQLAQALTSLLPRLSDLADILPKQTLSWKIKLLASAASYANSRLHAVNAEVLVLSSGKDNMLPSEDEGQRLRGSLKKCKVRYLKDNGHTLLLEDGINLMSIIKAMSLYRRSKQHDYITDFLPPSLTEFRKTFLQENGLFRMATSPVMLSTSRCGNIIRGLSGVPNEGPVLLVGYHMLMGFELTNLYEAFLREKRVVIRGMAHPLLFSDVSETTRREFNTIDTMKIFGALPVSSLSMYKLFSRNSFVLLYPGGAREALHRKGEEYRLFWPDQPEFVRMAAKFGATIVPFGAVGEDDIAELVLDYNDQMRIPATKNMIEDLNEKMTTKLRADTGGEVSKQEVHIPGLLPKLPGRFYYLFGKPIETKGMTELIKDREAANRLYLEIKAEIENKISYLKKKREEDPYRSVLQRAIYQASWGSGSLEDVPTFDP